MTSTTPEHNIPQCHAASEDRRQLLCRLKCLAERLDEWVESVRSFFAEMDKR